MPKTSSIRSAVSIEHRLVTDRETDTGPWLVPQIYIASCGNDEIVPHLIFSELFD